MNMTVRRRRVRSLDNAYFMGYGPVCKKCSKLPNPGGYVACYCPPILVRYDKWTFKYGPHMSYTGPLPKEV